MNIKLKKHRDNVEINVYHNYGSKPIYNNLITSDPNRIAQILMDLIVLGFPIEKAIKILSKRIKKYDWFGT